MYGSNGVGAAVGSAAAGGALAATGGEPLGWIVFSTIMALLLGVTFYRIATRSQRQAVQ